jgi:MarR family transcriptional regulator for hemolysin
LLQHDFENSVGHWICTTSHALRRTLEARLVQEGMTLRQWEVLAWLACEGDLSQTEMADRLGIEPPTLAGVLHRMERDGWLERTSCCDDRRKNRIHPTERAEGVWNGLMEICHQIRQQATAGLSADDLARLKATCEKIRQNLSDIGAPIEGDTQILANHSGDTVVPRSAAPAAASRS